MAAIVTLTPNPSLDISTTVEQVMPTCKLRCTAARRDPGGGINVARVVRQLGYEVTAIYPCGGITGELLAHIVEREHIASKTFQIADETGRISRSVRMREAGSSASCCPVRPWPSTNGVLASIRSRPARARPI